MKLKDLLDNNNLSLVTVTQGIYRLETENGGKLTISILDTPKNNRLNSIEETLDTDISELGYVKVKEGTISSEQAIKQIPLQTVKVYSMVEEVKRNK